MQVIGSHGGKREYQVDPHPLVRTIRDNKDSLRVLSYSYYTAITGWGYFGAWFHIVWLSEERFVTFSSVDIGI